MNVTLAYGADGLSVEVPHDAVVVDGAEAPPLQDPAEAIRRALAAPLSGPALADLVGTGGTVAVVLSLIHI